MAKIVNTGQAGTDPFMLHGIKFWPGRAVEVPADKLAEILRKRPCLEGTPLRDITGTPDTELSASAAATVTVAVAAPEPVLDVKREEPPASVPESFPRPTRRSRTRKSAEKGSAV